MTMPMSIEEKKRCKETVLKTLFRINKKVQIMRDCLILSGDDDFKSDYVVMAKNMALEIQDSSRNIEHVLHDLIDAPVVD